MTTLKIGILSREQYQHRVMAIASGELKPEPGDPKIWFHSMKSLAQVLSEQNMLLLKIIVSEKPESLTKLAEISGRKRSNLTRTLNTMAKYGIVELKNVDSKTKRPVAMAIEFDIHYSIA